MSSARRDFWSSPGVLEAYERSRLPAPTLYEHRRAAAGIPDGRAFELPLDLPPPRPMRPALDGEAP